MKKSYRLWIVPLALLLLTLACNFPGMRGSPAPETPMESATALMSTIVAEASPTATSDGGATPQSSPSPTPEADDEETCTMRAAFEEDITVPDDSIMAPGETFVKTWRIRNSGTCPWTEGTTFAYLSGDNLSAIDSISVPPTEPGEEIELSVEMEAPEEGGTYRSNWQLVSPEGDRFGGVFYAQIRVPSPTPTPVPTIETFSGPSHFLGAVNADCSAVNFTWNDATGETAYRIQGPNLDVNLPADAQSYRWSDPPTGLSQVTLTARGEGEDEVTQIETTIGVRCDGGQPDLTIASVAFSPTTPTALLPYTVLVEIANEGDADSGGFLLTWRSRKTAGQPTCEWVIGDGLAAGGSQTLTCAPRPFQSPLSSLVTQARIDDQDTVIESDEDNNVYDQATAVESPETAYDFLENAAGAVWSAGPPSEQLIWSGEPGDSQGYARLSGGALENGSLLTDPCLETRPKAVAGGWIQGHFTGMAEGAYTVQVGDHIHASIALLESGLQGNVKVRVMLKIKDGDRVILLEEPHRYGEGPEVLSADLNDYVGETVSIILAVDAGSSATDDRACWVDAAIYRHP